MSREEELQQLKDASRLMVENKTWPVTEDELINYHSSSFEFGFACGALWQKEQVTLTWEDVYSIVYIERLVMREWFSKHNPEDEAEDDSNEVICKEILKRFNEQRKEK